MSAKRQKLSHRKTPLSESFLVEDSAYVPPSSLRDEFGRKLQPEKRVPKEKAPRRVPRPQKCNLRDPFHTLGDDEVHLIIALLPEGDTETLRRVSKLWKASSEYHCGKGALMRHFPWATAKANRCETRDAANLQFRRCLHYQKNLEAGLATRAIRFVGASDWDIRENRLIWSRRDQKISIRSLRTEDDKSIVESETTNLDASHILPESSSTPYVRILPGGDFLMTTLMIEGKLLKNHRLVKVSAQGTLLWSIDLNVSMTRPAIGKDSVYFIHGPCYKTSKDSSKMLSFARHKLCDGSKVFDVPIPPELQAHRKIQDLDRSLLLTGNECLASWRKNANGDVYIFSTSSGQLLKTIEQSRIRNPPLLQSVVPSLDTPGFWVTTSRTMKLTTYDEVPGSFSDVDFYYVDKDPFPHSGSITFDGNHSVFLRTVHSYVDRCTSRNNGPNPFGQFAISPTLGTATVTLPGRSKREGKRREFELELPWELDEEDFFGMMNDYLIYQSPKHEFLVLVDFWPTW